MLMSAPMTASYRRVVLGALALCTLIPSLVTGCVNPARAPCLHSCSDEKDSCMLEATNVEAIQACDRRDEECYQTCPR